MSKKTAFGGDNNYQDFKSKGARITSENDFVALKEWLHKHRSEEHTLVQQAAAVCHAVSDISPHMFRPFQKELIDVLKNTFIPQALGLPIDYLPKFRSMKNTNERRLIFLSRL
jgi:hypothetical protein